VAPSDVDRKSDRVYILGSGASVLEIDDWNEIANHDSIGFNFWILHSFVPSVYFLEIPRDLRNKEKFFSALRERRKDYEETQVLLPYIPCKNDRKCVKSIFLIKHINLPFILPLPSVFLYKKILNIIYLKMNINSIFFCSGSSSVDKILNYCVAVGYKEIVLCGVDLNTTDYFYEASSSVNERVKMCIPENPHARRSMHWTNDPKYPRTGLTISESILSLQEVLNEKGIKLFVESPKSALAGWLPVNKL
jgi:hypothetical protein